MFKVCAILIIFLQSSVLSARYLSTHDSSKAREIKLDLVSVYNTLFDVRQQLRVGIEYQQTLTGRLASTYHIDFGLYDSYKYYKYYDFFNTSGGLYNDETKVKTYGFHFLYGLKYNFKRKPGKKLNYFVSCVTDLNFFRKDIKKIEGKTAISSRSKQMQGRIGFGPETGLSLKIKGKISLEIKSAVLFKVMTLKTDTDARDIKPYKAIWYDAYHSFWIIPRINICYAL